MSKEKIQRWIDDRFGKDNTFNIEVLLDFLEFVRKETTK